MTTDNINHKIKWLLYFSQREKNIIEIWVEGCLKINTIKTWERVKSGLRWSLRQKKRCHVTAKWLPRTHFFFVTAHVHTLTRKRKRDVPFEAGREAGSFHQLAILIWQGPQKCSSFSIFFASEKKTIYGIRSLKNRQINYNYDIKKLTWPQVYSFQPFFHTFFFLLSNLAIVVVFFLNFQKKLSYH